MKNYTKENQEYQKILFDKELGREARIYLKKRGITPQTAKAWGMGFSPRNFIPQCYQGITLKNNFYEKMNGRITLPVYDSNGKLVSISGRTIYDDLKPKYIHYQCPTHKLLYGLYINKTNIFKDDLCVFVEGQFDAINAWQHGFKNCVCTFGAHFSIDQIIYASRYCTRIAIMYDADEAGHKGVIGSLSKLKVRGDMDIRNFGFLLHNGQDVDEWINENNGTKVLNLFNRNEENWLKKKLTSVE